MEKYKKEIADLANVEMIHVSLDQDDDAAEEWAEKESFPWLTVLPDKVDRSTMRDYKTTNAVPEYHLVDGEGNSLAKGQAAAFAKIAELTKE
ncbi:hypothetical protein JIN78_06575 [Roseibacillus ishigakijimensis]|uniref:Thioredoxin-like fold domain-containing protein n=1 Tax=Roseibacillus ishigakijimensis TaxID=454146 RepID=A0A934RL51_9BACT|nr:hypothetical protein [Roseibacillus ishigakijimensis]